MTIWHNKVKLYIPWRFIRNWASAAKAARQRYDHGAVSVGPFVLRRW